MASFVGWSLNGDMPKSQELQRQDTTPDLDGPQTGFLMSNDWSAVANSTVHGASLIVVQELGIRWTLPRWALQWTL